MDQCRFGNIFKHYRYLKMDKLVDQYHVIGVKQTNQKTGQTSRPAGFFSDTLKKKLTLKSVSKRYTLQRWW